MTGLDWYSGPDGDRILSCSADRNAYVWTRDASSGMWKPALVLLRFKRGATCAQWTSDGTKFAVGGADGLVAVGHYDKANDWWVCKHLKKVIDGPVLSLAWHPLSGLIAASTLNGSLHLISAYIPEIDDDKNISVPWLDEAILKSFDAEAFSVQVGSWVYGIAFSKSGNAIAWSNQQAIVTVFYPQSGYQSSVQCLTEGRRLPLLKLLFLSENAVMAAGYSGIPIVIGGADGKEWSMKAELCADKISGSRDQAPKTSSITSRLAKFQMVDHQQTDQTAPNLSKVTGKKNLMHVSSITAVDEFEGNVKVHKAASLGLDGRLVIWTVGSLAS